MTQHASAFSRVTAAVHTILRHLLGRLTWELPPWLRWSGRQADRVRRWGTAHPVGGAAVMIAALLAGHGYYSYLQRPKPHYVTYVVTAPGVTTYDDKGMALIKPMSLTFSESVAPLTQVRARVTKGITCRRPCQAPGSGSPIASSAPYASSQRSTRRPLIHVPFWLYRSTIT